MVQQRDGDLKGSEWGAEIVRHASYESELLLPLPTERHGHLVERDCNLSNLARPFLRGARVRIALREALDRFNHRHQWLQSAAPEPGEHTSDSREQNDDSDDTRDVGDAIP